MKENKIKNTENWYYILLKSKRTKLEKERIRTERDGIISKRTKLEKERIRTERDGIISC